MKHRDILTVRARALRRSASDAEQTLWRHLRARRMMGRKFKRQVVLEPYIVDFACLEDRMIIEVDGGQHADREAYDQKRTADLKTRGYRVLRFWNHEILTELDAVLEQIRLALLETPSPQPSPASGRGS